MIVIYIVWPYSICFLCPANFLIFFFAHLYRPDDSWSCSHSRDNVVHDDRPNIPPCPVSNLHQTMSFVVLENKKHSENAGGAFTYGFSRNEHPWVEFSKQAYNLELRLPRGEGEGSSDSTWQDCRSGDSPRVMGCCLAHHQTSGLPRPNRSAVVLEHDYLTNNKHKSTSQNHFPHGQILPFSF